MDKELLEQRTWAIVRLVVSIITIANYGLSIYGWSPLPFTEETIYPIASAAMMLCALIWTWWKNNNITRAAVQAQETLNDLKEFENAKHARVD